jgi:hypothetical protein
MVVGELGQSPLLLAKIMAEVTQPTGEPRTMAPQLGNSQIHRSKGCQANLARCLLPRWDSRHAPQEPITMDPTDRLQWQKHLWKGCSWSMSKRLSINPTRDSVGQDHCQALQNRLSHICQWLQEDHLPE